MIQLDDAISEFLLVITVSRPTVSYDVNERVVTGTPTTFNISASVQPAQGRDLRIVQEGEYNEDVIVIYTTSALQTGQDSASLKPDNVLYQGQTYKVIYQDDWQHNGYNKYLARKLDEGVT